jgi:hypothetical protein
MCHWQHIVCNPGFKGPTWISRLLKKKENKKCNAYPARARTIPT